MALLLERVGRKLRRAVLCQSGLGDERAPAPGDLVDRCILEGLSANDRPWGAASDGDVLADHE